MTVGRCKKGCVNPEGKPAWHPGDWACPKSERYDPGKLARFGERKAAARRIMSGEASATPTGTPAGEAASAPASPSPEKREHTVLHDLELGSRVAETSRRSGNELLKTEEWELPSDSAQTFFETLRNALREIVSWADDLLQAEKTEEGRMKSDAFETGSHELSAARGGMGRRFATKVVKGLGAKTMQEGIETVDTLAFLSMFGMMFLQIAGHFIRLVPQSPRLKKLREAAEKKKAQAEERKRLAAEAQAKKTPQPPIPAAALPG